MCVADGLHHHKIRELIYSYTSLPFMDGAFNDLPRPRSREARQDPVAAHCCKHVASDGVAPSSANDTE